MQKNKEIHITYIGRLEKEKGIEMVIACMKRGLSEKRDIIWHICGDGSYLRTIQEINNSNIHVHGHVSRERINTILQGTDLVFMPSLFLETFGLVALETLSHRVPICGFARGGLSQFIHGELTLDPDDSVNSFFRILDRGVFPVVDISDFSHERWITKLSEFTEGVNRVLLVNDYVGLVGGAEQYVHGLAGALRSIGKTVEIHGYRGNTSRLSRILLMMFTPFAFWRGSSLARHIHGFNPDLIWMHSILRYIGPHAVQAVMNHECMRYITHHDLGLITPRPSQVYSEGDIPKSSSLGDWIPQRINIVSIMAVLFKWSYIQCIWRSLNQKTITHILPSLWMVGYFQKYYHTMPIVYPHSLLEVEKQ